MVEYDFMMPLLTLKSNGGGIVALELARSMAKMGMSVVIMTSSYYGVSATKLPENSKIKFIVVPSIGGKLISTVLLLFCGFCYSLKNKPNLIYTHIATSLIPNFSNVKAIWLAQDIEYRFYENRIRLLFKWALKRAVSNNYLLVTSNWLGKYFRRIGAEIIFIGDIGISKKIFNNLALKKKGGERRHDVLIIAKHGDHKRGYQSIALAKQFSESGLRVILIDQINAAQSSVANNLMSVGAVTQEELLGLLVDSKIFVSLSRSEGFGLVPLEALFAGCMVVTTPVPSVSKYKSDSLRIISGGISFFDQANLAVHQFISNPVYSSFMENGVSHFFLEDWVRYSSAALLQRLQK